MNTYTKLKEKIVGIIDEKRKVPADLPLPVKYDGMQYYWGKNGEMVADFDEGVDVKDGEGFRIRGWGRIQDEKRQNECAKYIERAINAYSELTLEDVLIAIGKEKLFKVINLHSKVTTNELNWIMDYWELGKTLSEQSPETMQFLLDILETK